MPRDKTKTANRLIAEDQPSAAGGRKGKSTGSTRRVERGLKLHLDMINEAQSSGKT